MGRTPHDKQKRFMRLKPDLLLHRLGQRYMIADAASGRVNLTHVYTLNDTAAHIWRYAEEEGCHAEILARRLCEDFDVDPATALADVERQLAEWKEQGLVI